MKSRFLDRLHSNDANGTLRARPVLVFDGAMGTKLPTSGHIDYDTLKNAYVTQVQGLYDGGADLLLVETCQDVLQIKAALNAIEEVFKEKGDRLH
jgi:methionine synthase I (cobalamin-dependent)